MKKQGKLANEIASLFSLLIAVITFSILLIITVMYKKSLKQYAHLYGISIADNIQLKIQAIEDEAKGHIDELINIFNSRFVSPEAKIELASIKLKHTPFALFIGIYDTLGNPLDFITRKNFKPAYISLKPNKMIKYFRIYTLKNNVPVLELISPWENDKKLRGFITLGISLNWLSNTARELSLKYLGMGNLVYIINKKGEIIAPFYKNTALSLRRYNLKPFIKNTQNLAALFDTHVSISSEYHSLNGYKVYGTLTSIPDLHWGVIVEQPAFFLYASLHKLQSFSLAIGLVAVLLAMLMARIISNHITSPLMKLEKGIEAISKADFSYSLDVRANNEVGRVAKEFNEMIKKLSDYRNQLIKETRMRAYLQRYLSLPFLSRLLSEGTNILEEKPAKHRATVMFVDISDFTTIASQMDVQLVAEYLNDFFKYATQTIFEYDGVIDKFIGDCIMALFGVPIKWEGMEKSAVKAALEIIKTFEDLSPKFIKKYGFPIKVKAGIATGEVIVGNIGSPNRMDYTAIGNTVNLASRLESIAMAGEIIIDENTKNAIEGYFRCEYAGEKEIKGFKEKVRIYKIKVT